MLCQNGLHELDPADPWRSSNNFRCRECWLATAERYNRSEKGQARRRRYKRPVESRVRQALAHRRRQALKARERRRHGPLP